MVGFLTFLFGMVASLFDREEVFPAGLVVVEVEGHRKHTGRVRMTRGGMVEVLEEPDTVPECDRVPMRLYGRQAIFQVRPMTAAETRALDEHRRFAARPCGHCGREKCPRKGTGAEHVHVATVSSSEMWCERWRSSDTQALAPAVAKATPSLITCPDCLEMLSTWEGPPGTEDGFAVRLIAAFCSLGGNVSVPVGRTERIEEAAARMRAAGAVLDEGAMDVLAHGDPSHVRERYAPFDGFEELAQEVLAMTGVEWIPREV